MKVAIVGAGISGLTAAYRLQQAGVEVVVLEREVVAGGKIRSSSQDGLTFDWGPNGFLSNAPDTLKLVADLGLNPELEPAAEVAKHRFIWRSGALHKLPGTPPAALATKLLTPLEKIRALLEYFIPAKKLESESVFDFAARRFGRAVAETFITPMVIGITSGDARATSLDALFPRMRSMEQSQGSLLRAMIAGQRQAKKMGVKPPSSRLTSFKHGGIQRLTDRLQELLGLSLQLGVTVSKLEPLKNGYRVFSSTGMFDVDAVILATPAFVSADLLEPSKPELALELRGIPYANVRVFGLSYNPSDVPANLEGFGFLAARDQGVRILGCLYTSTFFPQQTSNNQVFLRVICGGSIDPSFVDLSSEAALEVVKHDLQKTLSITAQPTSVQEARWDKGIPQYTLEHPKRLARIETLLQQTQGLYLAGNAYRGVGVNDCIREAEKTVKHILAQPRASEKVLA
jgi:protoporphyrinogen/coproporphyrinogen III oxidase